MHKDLITGLIWTAAIVVIGIVILFLASRGALPSGFGLFDMEDLGTRLMVFLVLIAIMVVLGFVYFRARGTDQEGDR